jgi:catechol 2,3-dioxygenase-like lactoylglutathione lyase family enzyme
MAIRSISVVSVPVTDPDRSRDFYVELLGFAVRSDASFGDGQRWLELEPPGGGTRITLVTWFDRMPPGSQQGLVLSSDDIEADVRALRGRGIDLPDPEHQPWGTFSTFSDPDGNAWVLVQEE